MVEHLIEVVPQRYRALVVLAVGTGMRQGECFGLCLDRIDFLQRTVRVDQQLVLLPHKVPFLAPPKPAPLTGRFPCRTSSSRRWPST
ncbi:MAG: tyrosine-type recombinase/integrase [Pseudonocardiales bacterium]|nr:tyrosine-type recombinase/integrase [Pseudonocardiales bacterium]